jgi:hypothetical protein
MSFACHGTKRIANIPDLPVPSGATETGNKPPAGWHQGAIAGNGALCPAPLNATAAPA